MIRAAATKNIALLTSRFREDSLFRNSILLMVSSLVQAGFGFLFWILCARLYSPEDIGIGGALISVVNFLSYFSLLGFNSALIKFLPAAKTDAERNIRINTSLSLVLLFSFLASLIYALLLPRLAPDLSFIGYHPAFLLSFVALAVFSTSNLLTDSIFVAYRSAQFNLLIYSIQSLLKVGFPLLFVTLGGMGIYVANSMAAALAFLLSLYLASSYKNYRWRLQIDRSVFKGMWKFSFNNYIANMINILPIMAVPLIVLNQLGAKANGQYYLAFTVSNLLYAVAYATSQSLFAEGSHNKENLTGLFKKSLLTMLAIMLPGSLVLALLGPYILAAFGKSYGAETTSLLSIFALAAPVVGVYVLCTALLRISGQVLGLIAMNIVYAGLVIGCSLMWGQNLSGIGWAWVVGNLVAALAGFVIFARARKAV